MVPENASSPTVRSEKTLKYISTERIQKRSLLNVGLI